MYIDTVYLSYNGQICVPLKARILLTLYDPCVRKCNGQLICNDTLVNLLLGSNLTSRSRLRQCLGLDHYSDIMYIKGVYSRSERLLLGSPK